jgi:hypothetical protein
MPFRSIRRGTDPAGCPPHMQSRQGTRAPTQREQTRAHPTCQRIGRERRRSGGDARPCTRLTHRTSRDLVYTKRFPNDSPIVRSFVWVIDRFGGKEGKHQIKKKKSTAGDCTDMDAYLVSIRPHSQLALLFFPFRRLAARLPSPSLLFRRRRRSRCKATTAMTWPAASPLPPKPPALFSLSPRQRSKSKSHAQPARGSFTTLHIYRHTLELDMAEFQESEGAVAGTWRHLDQFKRQPSSKWVVIAIPKPMHALWQLFPLIVCLMVGGNLWIANLLGTHSVLIRLVSFFCATSTKLHYRIIDIFPIYGWS